MYEAYLRQLLSPLGVYDLGDGSVNGAELYALGEALDRTARRLETVERESVAATAEEEGLDRREALFARRPAAVTAREAKALEMDAGRLRVIFPGVGGVPAEFEQIEKIILDILPCHLEVEFYFRYLTWEECRQAGYTWAAVEDAEHTWESFQLAVPPEA